MKTIKLLNENGNVIPSVRDELKNQVIAHSLTEFEVAPNGKLYAHIADDETGKPIMALLTLTITTDENQLVKTRSRKSQVKAPTIVPNLFE